MPSVLIVEDDPSLRAAIELTLRSHGHRVSSVGDGETCLEAVSASRPDVILLDIMLSTIDGWEVKRRLNENPATARIPVIAVTSLEGPEHRDRARRLGFAGYVVKPMRFEQIRAAINAARAASGTAEGE